MKATRVFFSFTEVTDPARHEDYNIWHMLDHRPENLALPGIAYGERWVCTPDCIAARGPVDPVFRDFQYMNFYWMQEPMDSTYKDFIDLAKRTAELGRRPELAYAKRHFTGIFMPVKGYVNPRVLVSPEALPYRPTKGLFVTVADLIEPDSVDAAEMLEWYDRVHIPDILECKGVAGAWTFSSDPSYPGSGLNPVPPGRRIHVYYLDEDPLESMADIQAHVPVWKASGHMGGQTSAQRMLFIGAMRTIIPWQWNWFDK